MTTMECGRKIELDSAGIAVTYCILALGHEGKCVPDAGIAARYARKQSAGDGGAHESSGSDNGLPRSK